MPLETTVLGIPCLTLRDNTERPENITIGTTELVGTNPRKLPPIGEKNTTPCEIGWKYGRTDRRASRAITGKYMNQRARKRIARPYLYDMAIGGNGPSPDISMELLGDMWSRQ